MEIKTVLRQMKIESQYTKINGSSKRRSKRKVYTDKYINVNVWQNPLQCCEVISLQLIKINEKKLYKEKWERSQVSNLSLHHKEF